MEQITAKSLRPELLAAIEAAIVAGRRIMEIYDDPEADFGIEKKADNSPLTLADKAAHEVICDMLEPLEIPILSEEGRKIDFAERASWERLWIVDPLDGTKEFIKKNGEFTVNIALVEPVEGGKAEPTIGVIYVPATKKLYFGDRGIGAYKVVKVLNTNNIKEEIEDAVDMALTMPIDVPSKGDTYVVVASRSHLSEETEQFIAKIEQSHPKVETMSKGSSLKICLVAEGKADIYPRFAPTMEWDTAAGDAILRARGGALTMMDETTPLQYNKEDLLNPFFIAK
ncbi:MAG: 3'(2'),5'-bisphosphate nucleotidase CysQ [Rikenellaceae bacterium]